MNNFATVAEEIEHLLASARVPGCSVALVDQSSTLWSAGIGWADLHGKRHATSATVYHLFSGTKLFTAAAVLKLAEQLHLSLDDSVSKFVPDRTGTLSAITLRDLLSHQTGLRDSLRAFLAVSFPPGPLPSTSAALTRYPIRAARPPRQKVEYRNVNYALLGEVVTRASGRAYADYVEEAILRPLGMRARFGLDPSMSEEAATGYIDRWDPMRILLWALFPETRGRLYGRRVGRMIELREFDLFTSAIGGLVGSVEDFATFLTSQLRGGDPIVRPETTRQMQTMVATGAAGIESREGIGLGWKFGRANGRAFLNHEGGGAGFTSELRLYPEGRLGIVLAMNMMRMPNTIRLAHRICEAVVGRAMLG
jgi:D-alanyl-D-alanine carboxypeptidase